MRSAPTGAVAELIANYDEFLTTLNDQKMSKRKNDILMLFTYLEKAHPESQGSLDSWYPLNRLEKISKNENMYEYTLKVIKKAPPDSQFEVNRLFDSVIEMDPSRTEDQETLLQGCTLIGKCGLNPVEYFGSGLTVLSQFPNHHESIVDAAIQIGKRNRACGNTFLSNIRALSVFENETADKYIEYGIALAEEFQDDAIQYFSGILRTPFVANLINYSQEEFENWYKIARE